VQGAYHGVHESIAGSTGPAPAPSFSHAYFCQPCRTLARIRTGRAQLAARRRRSLRSRKPGVIIDGSRFDAAGMELASSPAIRTWHQDLQGFVIAVTGVAMRRVALPHVVINALICLATGLSTPYGMAPQWRAVAHAEEAQPTETAEPVNPDCCSSSEKIRAELKPKIDQLKLDRQAWAKSTQDFFDEMARKIDRDNLDARVMDNWNDNNAFDPVAFEALV
jgi:hypothetical protein